MFRVKEVLKDIYNVIFDNRIEMCKTFVRFQEYYESPEFRNKIFTLGEYRKWYAKEHDGVFSYYTDWGGFNIPSYVLDPFKEGLFDPLTEREEKILEFFEDVNGKFYIIGTVGEDISALNHELMHGLFYVNSDYSQEVLEILEDIKVKKDLSNLYDHLRKLGYHESVFIDEAHAYIGNDIEYLEENNIPYSKEAHKKLKELYEKYKGDLS